MSLLGFITAAAGAWAVLAGLGGFSWAFVATRLKRRTQRIDGASPHCVPVYPTPTQADIDATWLDAWPASVEDVDELDRRFFAIVDRETRWFADGAA